MSHTVNAKRVVRNMPTEQRLDRELMRRSNEKYVLMTLLTAKEASKAYLSKKTGISLMSISRIADGLTRLGLLTETELKSQGTRAGGRPPQGLTINAEKLLCCGIHLGKQALHMSIVNPYGRVLEEEWIPYQATQDFTSDYVLAWMAQHLENFLKRWRGRGLLSNVGIVVSGIVDVEKGELEFSANLRLKNCGFVEYLKKAMPDFDFFLENDVKALAQAEYQYGASAGVQNIVVLNMDDGIGSATVQDGRLYRARHNIAGEIGHIILNPNGKVCECGQTGCLQTYLAKHVILNEARMMYPDINLKKLFERSQKNEPFAVALVKQVVDYASIAINLLATMYAPDVIVISGSTIWESPILRDMIEKNYKNRLNKYMSSTFQLKFDSFGPSSYVVGGAAVAFGRVIETLQLRHV